MTNNNNEEKRLCRQRAELAAEMGSEGNLLKGSLIERFTVCARAGCRCARGHKHGPYLYVSIFDGKQSRQIYVPKGMEKTVRSWVENYENTRLSINKISAHSIELIRLKHRKKNFPS